MIHASTVPSSTVRTLTNFVAGGFVRQTPGASRLDDRNPATGEVLATIPLSDAVEVDAAVQAAAGALPAWRATSPLVRARAVFRLRETLLEHQHELATLVTLDMGKTTDDAYAEVGRGIESTEAACGMPELLKGENLEGVARGVDVELVRQPLGVCAAITPFNFPAMIPLWFLPYAIAAGNTFVLKPSERDPLPSHRLMELIAQLDEIPPGVVNLVHGAHDAVNALLDHPQVAAVSFVGQASTARYVATRAATAGKRVQALGGAKNAMVVLPDADPKLMVKGVLGSAFGAAGQRCLAGSVLMLVGRAEEQHAALERIVAAAREMKVGDGARPETDVCPLIAPDARERIERHVEDAVAQGAVLALDGRTGGGPGGAEMGPTIIDGVHEDSPLVTEELFGPVLTVVRCPNLDGAIELVNASRYGNASVIFTSSGAAARQYRFEATAGMIGVNVGVAAPVAWFPFAGWKDSIDGDLHANGRDAVEFFTRKKVVTGRWT